MVGRKEGREWEKGVEGEDVKSNGTDAICWPNRAVNEYKRRRKRRRRTTISRQLKKKVCALFQFILDAIKKTIQKKEEEKFVVIVWPAQKESANVFTDGSKKEKKENKLWKYERNCRPIQTKSKDCGR